MTTIANGPAPGRLRTRRQFLTIAGCGALGAAGASIAAPVLLDRYLGDSATTGSVGPRSGGSTVGSGAPDPGFVLVSVQLGGGIDFLNTVVPHSDSRYRRIRGDGTLDVDGGELPLTQLDDAYSLYAMPFLGEQWGAGNLAIVHGVGWEGSSLSHFEATDMWEQGSPDLSTRTGWLGRALSDLAGPEPDPLLGLSLGEVSPSMYAAGWSPVGLEPGRRIPWSAQFREEYRALDSVIVDMQAPVGDDLVSLARNSQLDLRGIGARLGPIVGNPEDREPVDDETSDEEFAGDSAFLDQQFDLAADLINGGIPTRAFHVMHDGFDTHANQAADLPRLLGELDASLRRFNQRLGPAAERVVVATWSEFGRRPEWNGDGTEHGTAGVQFVVGPTVRGGHHGEPPPLDRFDDDDNFLVTTDFRDYLAGIAVGVIGADPAVVSDGGRGALDLIGRA